MSNTMTIPSKQSQPFRYQLRWSLIRYFLILAVVPVVIVQIITLTLTTERYRTSVINQLESVTAIKTNQVQRWIQEIQSSINSFLADSTHAEQMRNLLISGGTGVLSQGQVNQYLQEMSLANGLQNNGIPNLFESLFIYDPQGHILAASDDALIGKVVNRQPYFAHKFEDDFVQPPFYTLDGNRLIIVASDPILDAQHQPIGVFAGQLNIDTLGQIMTERAGLGNTGETYLVSLENNYLFTPSRLPGYDLNRAYHSEGIDLALQGKDGTGTYRNYRGVPVIGVYHWIPKLQAALLSEVEASEALSTSTQVLILSILIAIVAAMVAIVIGLNRIARISAPISALTQAAARITQGDFTQRAQINEQNEIGLLAHSFNQMTDQLVATISRLDQNVQTLDQTNQQLQIATSQAKEAVKVKDEFLATMSHELRTPLNAIIGFTGIVLMNDTVDQKNKQLVQRVESNSHRLLKLINDILDISKMEAGHLELTPTVLPIRNLIRKLQSQMAILAENKGLKFTVSIDDKLDKVLMDEDGLTKIITNLVANAIKFTDAGEVALKVEQQQDKLVIEVKDTGIGIPAHKQSIIFESFRQVDSSTSRRHGGSGLGLSIVRHLCNAMNGTISVVSSVGHGSVFTVTLPLNAVILEAVHQTEKI